MVCYTPTKYEQEAPLIRRQSSLSELQGEESKHLKQLLEEIQNSWKDTDLIIQRVLDNERENRVGELYAYLHQVQNAVSTTVDDKETLFNLLKFSKEVWRILDNYFRARSLNLQVPDACIGNSNQFMYTWIKGDHYLECEIFSSGEVEFFYKQKSSGTIWGEDTKIEHEFSTDILEKVQIFAQK